jgi:hypothetical protein
MKIDYPQTAKRTVASQGFVGAVLVLLLSLTPVSGKVFGRSTPLGRVQNKITVVGILSFQDETDSGAPAELGRKIAQQLKQRLALSFSDIVPKSLSADAPATLPVEQAAAIGRQNGVQFVVRGGLLAMTSSGQSNVTARVYAEIISVDSGTVKVVNAEGTGSGSGVTSGGIQWSAIDLNSASFALSAPGSALTAAIESLSNSLHQAVTTPSHSVQDSAATTSENANETTESAPTVDTKAEAEDELRQLIAQAEEVVASGAGDTDRLKPVNAALQKLKAALVSKASLLESGSDPTQSDQEIANAKTELQSALTVVTEQAASTSANSEEETSATGEKKSLLGAIDQRAGEALSLLQKIQELRSAFKGGAATGDVSEQSTGDVSGVVMQEGQPLAGVEVSDQVSGLSAMTGEDGSYTLKGLKAKKLSTLVLKKNGKQLTKGQIVPGQVADFELKSNKAAGQSAQRIVPSAIVLRENRSGDATGRVNGKAKDQMGKPLALALVSLSEQAGVKERVAVARTDSLGRYSFFRVPVGEYLLTIQKSGLRPTSTKVSVKPNGSSDVQSQLKADPQSPERTRQQTIVGGSSTAPANTPKHMYVLRDRNINDQTAPARVVANPAQPGGSLRGQVVDASSRKPISGATVSIAGRRARTDQAGNFDLGDLTPGNYLVKVTSSGFSEGQESVNIRPSATSREDFALKRLGNSDPIVRAVPQAPRVAVPIRFGQVRGRVVDSATGAPVASAMVAISGQQRAVTDRDGSYSLAALPPGSYQVSISKVGFVEKRTAFNIRAGETTNADFRLTSMTRKPRQ